jgi:hypothetical protein
LEPLPAIGVVLVGTALIATTVLVGIAVAQGLTDARRNGTLRA